MTQSRNASDERERGRLVRRVLLLEGAINLFVLLAKTVVRLSTGSMAVLGDALHSLTDVVNNLVALVLLRLANVPPDRQHPYGHRKFETLALATLLTILAFEIALRTIVQGERTVTQHGWELAVMLGVLGINLGVVLWQGYWARQLVARGYVWLDTIFALGVAVLVLFLAYDLFKRAVPMLVDSSAVEPEALTGVVCTVPGVQQGSPYSLALGRVLSCRRRCMAQSRMTL